MKSIVKRLALLTLITGLSLQTVCATDAHDETPFQKSAAALEDMIKSISPQSPQKAALDKMEKEIQRHCLSMALASKDFGSLALLVKLKNKFAGLLPIFVEPYKQFIQQIKQSGLLGTMDIAGDQTEPLQTVHILTIVSPNVTSRIDTLCQHLFKATLEDSVLSLVYATCNVTESQLTTEERTELRTLAYSFGSIARQNIAKSLTVSELDDLIKFCNSALFGKLRSTLPTLIQIVVNTFPMEQDAKERIYSLAAKACA